MSANKSRRGFYYNLDKSPYEFTTPYGDLYKFPSAKKLEIYTRDVAKEIKRVDDLLNRNNVNARIPDEIVQLIKRTVYQCFYDSMR